MEKGDPNKNKKKNNMNDKNWFTNNTSVINIITNMYIYIYIVQFMTWIMQVHYNNKTKCVQD